MNLYFRALKYVKPYLFRGLCAAICTAIAAGGTADDLRGAAVKKQAVGGDNFQRKACHAFSPPRNLATTSSMEPANRK